jgi:hypothetical protein
MTKFYDLAFCGLRGGDSFQSMTRVDPETGKCPSGKLPCSPNTSKENTVCMDPTPGQTETDYSVNQNCPVTDVLLLRDEAQIEAFE